MSNVIPLRPDPLRNLYELIDSIHDTNPTPDTKRIADEALALVQKMIEARELERGVIPTKLSDAVRDIRQLIDQQGGYNFEALKQEQANGEDDVFPA